MELVMSILNSIGIRGQLVLMQLIGFLFVFFILKTFLFGRVQRVLAERAADEERRRQAIAASKKDFEAAKAKADARNAEIEKQAYEQTQAEVRAGLKRKADAASAAMDKARQAITGARTENEKEHDRALATLKEDVTKLAIFVASRVTRQSLEESGKAAASAERAVAAAMATRSTGGQAI